MTRGRRRQARPGFIFLLGTRTLITKDKSADPVKTVCPRCNQPAELLGKAARQWFTLFFLPVFPISAARRFTQCSNCGAQFAVAPNQIQARLAAGEQQQSQEAITLYNSMRASPANAITLNQLLMLYGSMNEYDQALGAAADFPQALHSSEQCMATLGRIYSARGDVENAKKWFDAALARNPTLGEAHYYKAAACLSKSPPEVDQAVFHARAARKAAYPNADALVREAESKSRGEQAE